MIYGQHCKNINIDRFVYLFVGLPFVHFTDLNVIKTYAIAIYLPSMAFRCCVVIDDHLSIKLQYV